MARIGGNIYAANRPTGGAVFTLNFPLAHTQPTRTAQDGSAKIQPHRVLVADDDPANLQALSDLLESKGHSVIRASSGPEALEILLTGDPSVDIVFCDLGMPLVNGPSELSEESREPSSLDDLIGVWRGSSICRWSRIGASCRGGVDIAFTLLPGVGSKMRGFYNCTSGAVRCRNRLENGKVGFIEINGRRLWLRVMLADGSSCLFTSRLGRARMAGGYECLQGAGLIEQGQWWIERSY